MAALVVDCSVTLAWLLSDEDSVLATRVLERVVEAGAVVPSLWPLEVGNALLMAKRRGRLTGDCRAQMLRDLAQLPIALDEETASRAWRETNVLAEMQDLTLYDAAYLELAIRSALPLATLDYALIDAAGRTGVALFES